MKLKWGRYSLEGNLSQLQKIWSGHKSIDCCVFIASFNQRPFECESGIVLVEKGGPRQWHEIANIQMRNHRRQLVHADEQRTGATPLILTRY